MHIILITLSVFGKNKLLSLKSRTGTISKQVNILKSLFRAEIYVNSILRLILKSHEVEYQYRNPISY